MVAIGVGIPFPPSSLAARIPRTILPSRAQRPQQANQRCRFEFRYLFELETEDGVPFPTYNGVGDINGGVLIGPNMKFYRDTGRNVNGAHQPTPSEGKVKHETFLETHTVSGKNTFETDKITLVLTVLHCGFHSPLLVSLMLSETETVDEQVIQS